MLRNMLLIAFLQCLKKIQVRILYDVVFTIHFHLPKWYKLLSRFFLSQFPSMKNSTVCLKWQNSAMIQKKPLVKFPTSIQGLNFRCLDLPSNTWLFWVQQFICISTNLVPSCLTFPKCLFLFYFLGWNMCP